MRQILYRTLAMAPVMLFVAFFVFAILHLAPGAPAVMLAGDMVRRDQVQRIRDSMGLDRPMLVQFFHWMASVVQGNLGVSLISKKPAAELISQRLEATFSLMLLTLVFFSWQSRLAFWLRGATTGRSTG